MLQVDFFGHLLVAQCWVKHRSSRHSLFPSLLEVQSHHPRNPGHLDLDEKCLL